MQRARTVHLFASFGSEVDTGPLMDAVLASERAAVLPVVVEQDWGLEHARVLDRSDLAPGFRGIPEPRPSCTRVSPADIDLVVTPGVAFDRSLWRLGYGGGFYDRFLEACSAPRVALAFSCQIVESVPRDDWDLPVHVLVTEDEVLRRSS